MRGIRLPPAPAVPCPAGRLAMSGDISCSIKAFCRRQEQPCNHPVSGHRQPNISAPRRQKARAVLFPQQKGPAMGLFTKDIKTMNDLFVHQLQDIYYAEKQLVKALPKMAEKATDKQLKQGFLTHLDETKA